MPEKTIFKAGFRKLDITPDYPVSIIGYFNDRISEGALDRLYLRAAMISANNKNLLILELDTCCIPNDDAESIKNEISKQGRFRNDEILIFAIHTHTGPSLISFYESVREEKYFEFLKSAILSVAQEIKADREVTIRAGEIPYEDLTYNRRWFMKDGKVATNPPKMHPDRVKPEGPVDRDLRLISFHDKNEKPLALFCNISNHTDTIGGNLLSADWPGIMEEGIQKILHSDIPVFTFIAPQGNINHYDFDSPDSQSGYDEARRIGKAYAKIAARALEKVRPVPANDILSEIILVDIPPREVSNEDIAAAKEILERFADVDVESDKLGADDIFKGNIAVKKIFAQGLLDFVAHKKDIYRVPLQVIRLGDIIFFAIPGEPFVEIGLQLLKAAKQYGYKTVFPVGLANGYFGYIPLEENFPRGGYEVSAVPGNPLSRKAAEIMVETFIKWMNTH